MTLEELKEMVELAIAKHGKNTVILVCGCYGSTGNIFEIKEYDATLYLETDLCSG